MRQAVIVAGGLGSRLVSAGIPTPKLLLKVGEKTLLQWIIEELEFESFSEVLFCLGEKSEQIISELTKIKSSIRILTYVEPQRLGTLGALIQAKHLLRDNFVVILGDLFIYNINLRGLFDYFVNANTEIMTLVKFSNHPKDSDLVILNDKSTVTQLSKYPHQENFLEPYIGLAGITFFNKSKLSTIEQAPQDIVQDFFLNELKQKNPIIGIFHQGIIRDAGTEDRLADLNNVNMQLKRRNSESKLVLIDRDGILNVLNGHITNVNQVVIPDSAIALMKFLNSYQIDNAVVTNQPIVAKGELSLTDAFEITKYIYQKASHSLRDDILIFLCPHHPDVGFHGEILNLKLRCTCRKPLPGMLLSALEEKLVRGTNVIMIGDQSTDIQAGLAIGAQVIHVHGNSSANHELCNHWRVTCVDMHKWPDFSLLRELVE